jgi:hypothetical protein
MQQQADFERIARPPTPQLSSRFDSSATHARELMRAALASVPLYDFEFEFERLIYPFFSHFFFSFFLCLLF